MSYGDSNVYIFRVLLVRISCHCFGLTNITCSKFCQCKSLDIILNGPILARSKSRQRKSSQIS
uniref:Uncharacterized protein n=1 Tax=viral metagenome TaxID=1070528 RepID=A0A6C0CAP0_9ZZZZ